MADQTHHGHGTGFPDLVRELIIVPSFIHLSVPFTSSSFPPHGLVRLLFWPALFPVGNPTKHPLSVCLSALSFSIHTNSYPD
ncbi:hypothetical protein CBS147345_4659 [Aspergillus niger]|nr:hypothetical protein CBS147345_4659 [Aspergillus niger]